MVKFELNTEGKDFVVGDIHGCYGKLQDALNDLMFDEQKDRLFAVGDLVDRGPQSHHVLEWLAKSWFHSVRGNHDQMAIDFVDGFQDLRNYEYNGGGWFLELSKEQQWQIAEAFRQLPLAIEVATSNGPVGIVHADVFGDWNKVDKRSPIVTLWGRDRLKGRNETPVENIHAVFTGHTPLSQPAVLGNVHFIDTGAVFGKAFTIVHINP